MMKSTLFISRNSYGEPVNNIQINASFPFNRTDAQIIPYNLPYHQTSVGISCSSLHTEADFAIDSAIIYEMRTLQRETPSAFIPVFFFRIQTQTFDGKNKREQSSLYLRVAAPWQNIDDSEKTYHGATISMEAISEADLPKPALQINLVQKFDQENLQAAYEATQALQVELTAHTNLQNIRLSAQAYKQTLATAAPIPQLLEGQSCRVSIDLPNNLAQTLTQAQQRSSYNEQARHILNITATNEQPDAQHQQNTQFFALDNPVFVALAKTNHQIALQIKDILQTHFPQSQANINEQDEWFHFQIDGHNFQYGLEKNAVYVCVDFERIDYRVSSKTLKNELSTFNQHLKLKHKLKEINSSFAIEAKISLPKLNNRAIVKLLNELLAIANNPSVKGFMSPYESR